MWASSLRAAAVDRANIPLECGVFVALCIKNSRFECLAVVPAGVSCEGKHIFLHVQAFQGRGMKKVSFAILLLAGIVTSPWALAASNEGDSHQATATEHARTTDASSTQQSASSADKGGQSSSQASSSDQEKSASNSSADDSKTSKPALSPTGYVEALLPSLSVARDLGHNCQAALASNASDKKVCDQFERSLSNLADRQKKIESTTPRPKDTSSVSPQLMKEFNGQQAELKRETLYLRAYRATQ